MSTCDIWIGNKGHHELRNAPALLTVALTRPWINKRECLDESQHHQTLIDRLAVNHADAVLPRTKEACLKWFNSHIAKDMRLGSFADSITTLVFIKARAFIHYAAKTGDEIHVLY